ncbi:MAG TPA: hypothetical protein VKB53_11740 [Gammaproteobacteria bacterium]|nr:hypothetical protein [Gammaproteobacteria bacterium]
MTNKRKVRIPAPKRDPNRLAGEIKQNEIHADALAGTSLQPTINGPVTVRAYSKAFGELDLTALSNELVRQAQVAVEGDLTRAEAMLIAQAHTLDAIFNTLVWRSMPATEDS